MSVPTESRHSRFVRWGLACGWLASILVGFAIIIDRDLTPGDVDAAPSFYPQDVLGPRTIDRPTLVMFAHPRCPCTHASLNELRQILERHPGTADVRVYFRTPATTSEDWTGTALWNEAAALPDTTLVSDIDGAVARRCGVATSGQVVLYGANGKLLFFGGITGSRGHGGQNPGQAAVTAILSGELEAGRRNPTFGCPLFDHRASGKSEACCRP